METTRTLNKVEILLRSYGGHDWIYWEDTLLRGVVYFLATSKQ